jgi:hypothetical protein
MRSHYYTTLKYFLDMDKEAVALQEGRRESSEGESSADQDSPAKNHRDSVDFDAGGEEIVHQ